MENFRLDIDFHHLRYIYIGVSDPHMLKKKDARIRSEHLLPNSNEISTFFKILINKERKSEYFEYVDFLTNIGISYTEPELLKL